MLCYVLLQSFPDFLFSFHIGQGMWRRVLADQRCLHETGRYFLVFVIVSVEDQFHIDFFPPAMLLSNFWWGPGILLQGYTWEQQLLVYVLDGM